jgi:hypothetical protein
MGQLSSGAFDGSGTGTFSGGKIRELICTYDFAVQGGAIGTIKLATVPTGTKIIDGWMDVLTPVASSGGSAGIDSEATSDVVTSAATTGAPWSTTGKKVVNPVRATKTSIITTTQQRDIVLNITAGAVTAGKFQLVLEIL